ncbi:hypothetical protein [Limnothrix sp. FACHB-1088]|nr:hypothetical protein [Limnothrix sp. FACHB-1088]
MGVATQPNPIHSSLDCGAPDFPNWELRINQPPGQLRLQLS